MSYDATTPFNAAQRLKAAEYLSELASEVERGVRLRKLADSSRLRGIAYSLEHFNDNPADDSSDLLSDRERKMVERLRDDHTNFGCPADPKRAAYCADEPCKDATFLALIDRLAPQPKIRN